jgi:hypothetical protein
MWVHGNAVTAKFGGGGSFGSGGPMRQVPDSSAGIFPAPDVPWSDVIGLRFPNAATYRGQPGHNNVFMFAIPTPVIVKDIRARILSAMVLFELGPGTQITQVQIHDARSTIQTFPVSIRDSHPNLDASNRFTVSRSRPVSFGISLAVLVSFDPSSGDHANEITFLSAGVDFDIPGF